MYTGHPLLRVLDELDELDELDDLDELVDLDDGDDGDAVVEGRVLVGVGDKRDGGGVSTGTVR
jgi:hypothetical protein